MAEYIRITYDVLAGNPHLPDVTDETFTPAEELTYLGLLTDFGWLSREEYDEFKKRQIEESSVDQP